MLSAEKPRNWSELGLGLIMSFEEFWRSCVVNQTQDKTLYAHLDSSKLTGQVQRGLLGLVDHTGVGLMLQQHLRLKQTFTQQWLRWEIRGDKKRFLFLWLTWRCLHESAFSLVLCHCCNVDNLSLTRWCQLLHTLHSHSLDKQDKLCYYHSSAGTLQSVLASHSLLKINIKQRKSS